MSVKANYLDYKVIKQALVQFCVVGSKDGVKIAYLKIGSKKASSYRDIADLLNKKGELNTLRPGVKVSTSLIEDAFKNLGWTTECSASKIATKTIKNIDPTAETPPAASPTKTAITPSTQETLALFSVFMENKSDFESFLDKRKYFDDYLAGRERDTQLINKLTNQLRASEDSREKQKTIYEDRMREAQLKLADFPKLEARLKTLETSNASLQDALKAQAALKGASLNEVEQKYLATIEELKTTFAGKEKAAEDLMAEAGQTIAKLQDMINKLSEANHALTRELERMRLDTSLKGIGAILYAQLLDKKRGQVIPGLDPETAQDLCMCTDRLIETGKPIMKGLHDLPVQDKLVQYFRFPKRVRKMDEVFLYDRLHDLLMAKRLEINVLVNMTNTQIQSTAATVAKILAADGVPTEVNMPNDVEKKIELVRVVALLCHTI